MLQNLKISTALLFSLLLYLGSCSSPPQKGSSSFQKVGSFAAVYNANDSAVSYYPVDNELLQTENLRNSPRFSLDYTDTTGVTNPDGVTGGAIVDTTKSSGEINREMGLVDPDSCATEYNPTTRTLSFYSRLTNKSDYANDGAPYVYTDPTDFPPNTTFYSPFHFVITGLNWDIANYPGLITAVNTNLKNADCDAGNGLSLVKCDQNDNQRFDSIWPDNPVNDYVGLPGFDFTPFTNGVLIPGQSTGCVLFMQFTLTQNQNFVLYFDVLGVKDDGSLPPKPMVSAPNTPSYVNTNTIAVEITNCRPGRTLYVDGGLSPASIPCGGLVQSIDVTLEQNVTNYLTVYQKEDATQKQSPSTNLVIIHDNIAPQVVISSPANNQESVSEHSNCVVTFSEPMKESTFTSGSNCSNGSFRVCQGGTFIPGQINLSTDGTSAVYDSNAALSTNAAHTCNVTTGVTDLAGNPLNIAYSASFTTRNGAFGEDQTQPHVVSVYPSDNSRVSTNTSFFIYFSEPMNESTLTATNCDGPGTPIPNLAFWQTNACVTSNYPTSRPNPITGTISMNATKTIATFTPNLPLENDDCIAMTLSSCVSDLSGNTLPNRGNFAVGAYGGNTVDYNTWTIFYTKDVADTSPPVMVHTGPMLNALDVSQRIFPFWVFNEPIDPVTMISDYFLLNVFGLGAPLAGSVTGDPTLQFIMLKPSLGLDFETKYVMTATGAVTDVSGNQMTAPQTSQFTVGRISDTTPPTVLSAIATNVTNQNANPPRISRCSFFDIRFSEAMDTNLLTSANILLRQKSGNIKPTSMEISADGSYIRLIPESSLQSNGGPNAREYRIEISGVKDRSGNALASNYIGSYYHAENDGTRPLVRGFAPNTSIPENGSIAVFFDEPMDRSTLVNGNFVFGGGAGCPFQSVFPAEDGTWAIVNCYHNMVMGAGRTLTLAGGSIKDRATNSHNNSCENNVGNSIDGSPSISFTVTGADTTPPTVNSVNPSDGSGSVSVVDTPYIVFSEAIDPRTVLPTSVFLMTEQGEVVPTILDVSANATLVKLEPVGALANDTVFYIVATTAVRDLGGGNAYDGNGGENIPIPGILRTCFATGSAVCP